MTKHILSSSHTVPADLEQVWDFFSRAENLGRITPRSMDFDMHTAEPMTHAGVDHRLHPATALRHPHQVAHTHR